jgi:hypothetical protein
MDDAFQAIADEMDLESAVRRGSERNDLLPPRLEDGVLGEVGKRFSEGLKTRVERGRYDPIPAETILVPKPGNTTRPASLLTLSDRIVFDAIVEILRPRIETALLGSEVVLWPRGLTTDKRWSTFQASPLINDKASFVAIADVTGFYETIDHERLRDALVSATGRRAAVNALIEFLGRVMRAPRGIPQGLAASDPIATAYLAPVDSAMARACVDYSRHGDDIRIAAPSLSQARHALYLFEQELRRIGLLVNSSKSIIMRRAVYEETLASSANVNEETRKALLASRVSAIRKDQKQLEQALDEAGREQLGWDLFYHGTISLAEAIQELEPHLLPTDMDVAIKVLRDALSRFPGTEGGLTREEFHVRATSSLIRLAAGKSPLAIDLVGDLSARFPEKTEVIATYLAAQRENAATSVIGTVIGILRDDRFRTAWETAWLPHVLTRFAAKLSDEDLTVVRRLALDEEQSTLCRVAALKVLGLCGELEHAVVRRIWNTAPPCFRPDLVAAVHHARKKQTWCDNFLAGVVEDPVNKVVMRHLERAA